MLLFLRVLVFGYTLWLGLYLLSRAAGKVVMRFTALGLMAYALGIGLDALSGDGGLSSDLLRLRWPLLFLPPLFWIGATLHLHPDMLPSGWARRANYGLPLLALLYFAITAGTGLVFDYGTDPPGYGALYGTLVAAVIAVLLFMLARLWRTSRSIRQERTRSVLLTAALFFALGIGLLLIPLGDLSRTWVLFAIGLDLELLGITIGLLDAFDEGETLLPDILRSFGVAAVTAVLFGGQVALVMAINERVTTEMLALLLAVVGTAVATQTFADPLQTLFDRLVFVRLPRLRRARADLRAVTSALPRIDETLDLQALDDKEFDRLTRRALGNMGDLQRLAASPLTRLAVIEARLHARGADGNTLERAAELKIVLAESIERLKPRDKGAFGTADEWRYYNALYFPYVVGLKPFSRRGYHNGGDLDPAAEEALAWFRAYVPERTLHNWQNAAARLVAQDLRERVI